MAFLSYDRATNTTSGRGTNYALVLVAFVCVVASTLSKETGVCIVAVLIAHDVMRTFERRINQRMNQRIEYVRQR